MILIAAFLILSFGAVENTGPGHEQTCLDCHGPVASSSSSQPITNSGEETPGIKEDDTQAQNASIIDPEKLKDSAHAKLTCAECHTDSDIDHQKVALARVDCNGCHEQEAEHFNLSIHSQVATADNKKMGCTDCHGAHDAYAVKDPRSAVFPFNQPETCGTCHQSGEGDLAKHDIDSYFTSIHFESLTKSGLLVSATCSSCHNSHDIRKRTDLESPVHRFQVAKTCATCHEGAYEDWAEGVHGQAFQDGDFDAPVCTHCHGEHDTRDRLDPLSRVNAMTVSNGTCILCHGPEKIKTIGEPIKSRSKSFEDSFHGLAARFGDPTVANCASCHGSHKILNSSNPASQVHQDNLPKTCGSCHPGAGENFAKGSVHNPTQSTGGHWLVGVRYAYILIITFTLLIMVGHNLLDYFKKLRDYNKKVKRGWKHERFNGFERLQHVATVLSFTILVITGFALKYPEAAWVQPLVDFRLGFLVRSYGHRIAAIIFMVLAVVHVYYLILTRRGRGQLVAMWPSLQDLKDVWHQLRYYLDMERKSGHFGRFSYVEKMEYLALLWGSLVMIVTGLILWFEESALLLMPKWGWDVAELVHLLEAWLATLAIIAWHLYHVMFKPSAHEFTLAMVTGNLSEEAMKHEHPEEYEKIVAQEKAEEISPDETTPPITKDDTSTTGGV